MGEYLGSLAGKSLPPSPIEQRCADYSRRLREIYLKNLEEKRARTFAFEAESGGAGADLARLEEAGIEPSIQLKEIYSQKARRRPERKEATR